jgi:signal transduction histidine kinase
MMHPVANDNTERLSEEQDALRRVVTLVAGAPDPSAVFDLVTREASRVLDLPILTLVRFEPDQTATVMAAASDGPFPVGITLPLGDPSVIKSIAETRLPARIESYEGLPGPVATGLRAAGAKGGFGVPIFVEGTIWGAMAAVQTSGPVPDDAEERLAKFTELIAFAISSAQARQDLRRLAGEQASLRRVATMVARGSTGEGFLSLVAAEVQQLFAVPTVMIVQYEGREAVVAGIVGGRGEFSLGARWLLDGPSVCATILDSGQPARLDDYNDLPGSIAQSIRAAGVQSCAGAPISINARVWGAIIVTSPDALPERAELRVAEYTELVATAISNAANHAELVASRARIVAASDEARRRVERNLHDGIQQRLIALALDVQTLRAQIGDEHPSQAEGLDRLGNDLESVLEEVHEIARGLHPALLARRGLLPALRALARRSPIPVDLHVSGPRPPEQVEIATYYAASEALTNAIKHSHASMITITIESEGETLRAAVEDDGIGGADLGGGTGLSGLTDRIEALGGTLAIINPAAGGTRIEINLPLGGSAS